MCTDRLLGANKGAEFNRALEITPSRVLEFGAALLEAKYHSAEQYLGALRLAHVERDHAVTHVLKWDKGKRTGARVPDG